MGLFNPFYIFVVPFLLLCTVPLALFAGLTTILAFTWLTVRVTLVYIDIGLRLVPHWLLGDAGLPPLPTRGRQPNLYHPYSPLASTSSPPLYRDARLGGRHRRLSVSQMLAAASSNAVTTRRSATTPSPPRRGVASSRHSRNGSRRVSIASASSSLGSITPISEQAPPYAIGSSDTALAANTSTNAALTRSVSSGSALAPSVGIDRDFEGVGGWRLGGSHRSHWSSSAGLSSRGGALVEGDQDRSLAKLASDRRGNDDADDSDSRWTRINSRLELPLDRDRDRSISQHYHQLYHHRRSPSGDPTTPGEGGIWLTLPKSKSNPKSTPQYQSASQPASRPDSSSSSGVATAMSGTGACTCNLNPFLPSSHSSAASPTSVRTLADKEQQQYTVQHHYASLRNSPNSSRTRMPGGGTNPPPQALTCLPGYEDGYFPPVSAPSSSTKAAVRKGMS